MTIEKLPRNSATWLRGKTLTTAPLDSGLLERELYLVDPVREGAAYPNMRNYHGHYWMASTGTHVWHESLLERDWLMWLDFTGDVVAVSSQPMMMTGSDGVVRYPDLLTLDTRGLQNVYDVRPSARINDKARAQFEWTRAVCEDIGMSYRVLTDIPMQFKVNLSYLSQFRHPANHPGVADEQEVVSAATTGWSIDDAVRRMPAPSTARARRHIFHLLWTGALTCDMDTKLSGRTLVHVGDPINSRKVIPSGQA